MKRTAAMLLLFAVSVSARANDVIRVVPVRRESPPIFKCGAACRFRGAVPAGPLRVRIFRGTIAELSILGDHPGNVAAGCIEFDTWVARPRKRSTSELRLPFYFQSPWLPPNGNNGQYVFVVERDDQPNGPELQRNAKLRLPSVVVRRYFSSGADVTVLALVNRRPPPKKNGHTPTGHETAAMMIDDSPRDVALTSLAPPPPPPPAMVRNDCVDVQIDPQANTILRSAELEVGPASGRPFRGRPARTSLLARGQRHGRLEGGPTAHTAIKRPNRPNPIIVRTELSSAGMEK